jgi:DNA gyrase subunit B
MPELIERGHIYIAQPPLYKVKVGKEERYLKDDHERDQFMLRQALVGAALYPRRDADPIRGDALAQLAQSYLLAEAVIDRLARLIDEGALKAILQGARIDLSDAEAARASVERLSARLGNGEVKVQARYEEKLERHQLVIERNRHGNLRWSVIDEDFLVSGDYRQIIGAAQLVEGLIGPGAYVQRGDHQHVVTDFGQAVHWLRAEVERNATIQRYKGLGEMNPEQLWETTMEPASRRLLKVQIEDAITADEIFIKLMGDEVEPRRDFIEQNALVARLDV